MVALQGSKINQNWFFRYSDLTEENEHFAFVVNDLLEEFVKYVPVDMNRPMFITKWSSGHPRYVIDTQNILFDTAGPGNWDQTVYQLAHELCHFAIYHGIQQEYKWFEESLCEMASYFFLLKMSERWSTSSDLTKIQYSKRFVYYEEDSIKDYEEFNLSDLKNDNSTMYQYLSQNSVDRDKDRFVAKKILPIILEQPVFWQAIPRIESITDTNNFMEFLKCWADGSPSNEKAAIQEIIDIFH